jgi:hypothetical protein
MHSDLEQLGKNENGENLGKNVVHGAWTMDYGPWTKDHVQCSVSPQQRNTTVSVNYWVRKHCVYFYLSGKTVSQQW